MKNPRHNCLICKRRLRTLARFDSIHFSAPRWLCPRCVEDLAEWIKLIPCPPIQGHKPPRS
jgi:hypothetical protein